MSLSHWPFPSSYRVNTTGMTSPSFIHTVLRAMVGISDSQLHCGQATGSQSGNPKEVSTIDVESGRKKTAVGMPQLWEKQGWLRSLWHAALVNIKWRAKSLGTEPCRPKGRPRVSGLSSHLVFHHVPHTGNLPPSFSYLSLYPFPLPAQGPLIMCLDWKRASLFKNSGPVAEEIAQQ